MFWYENSYLIASPLRVETGGEVIVHMMTGEPRNLALGLFHPEVGLVKNYGCRGENIWRVNISPGLPSGIYYFTVAPPGFYVNSGAGTYAWIEIYNPGIRLDTGVVVGDYYLVRENAMIYEQPGVKGNYLHTLVKGAVVKVLAEKIAGGEHWYWVKCHVYNGDRESAGWIMGKSVVPLTEENYRKARDVKLRPGARYYEQGKEEQIGEWQLAEEVLWVVKRRNGMVRLHPSAVVNLAVDGDIWTSEENLVYFNGSK